MLSNLPKLLCLVTGPPGMWVSLWVWSTQGAAFVGTALGDYSATRWVHLGCSSISGAVAGMSNRKQVEQGRARETTPAPSRRGPARHRSPPGKPQDSTCQKAGRKESPDSSRSVAALATVRREAVPRTCPWEGNEPSPLGPPSRAH